MVCHIKKLLHSYFFSSSGYQDKYLKAEENLILLQESNKRESASLQLLVHGSSDVLLTVNGFKLTF